MSDPTTELAREFLEFNNYIVKKETKFHKNKKLKGTAGDIDIIAVSPRGVDLGELRLKKNIVAEVKNWEVLDKENFDGIYDDKFKFIDNYNISWKQIKKYITSKRFDRVLFCLATTQKVYDYAYKKYGVKIITAGFIIKQFCKFYKDKGKFTYYPEAYNFSMIRAIMYYLYSSHKFKDQLTLKDLIWIDPVEDTQYRNKFNRLNGKFMAKFLYYDDENLKALMKDDPTWFLGKILELWTHKNKKYLKKVLQKQLKKL